MAEIKHDRLIVFLGLPQPNGRAPLEEMISTKPTADLYMRLPSLEEVVLEVDDRLLDLDWPLKQSIFYDG